ncbi:1-deoxy-D-xylulose-5-phosphate synthase [Immundisolibacter cernigliae]|uniref:1-deoxy-D-xylulose-5-phosphate synthase n=1 Tax=Immundisolibacter cernigliae TaxID=1810504 RepID=A0A1B1YUC0_9GAMM|nr:1-deoxy-D-xylulose-5-phosphate synthase [Immundisolibacter cernigliae]ANX04332.1 1-deoxy-D-xylulose-5-phosphate synthase [Immundisolibacter cernigliae]
MNTNLLDSIHTPANLRELPASALTEVAAALREEIVTQVARSGGHLASSLGAVELLLALHYVFDTPHDRLVLDVGHQGYAHKLLTGRREQFASIGKEGGPAKFLRRSESPFDTFGAGHAGTSISAALGMARGLQAAGEDACAVALIGDGALTAGMALEALNHAGHIKQSNLLVVLNDNEMSIEPNVGAIGALLSRTLSAPSARRLRRLAKDMLAPLPQPLQQLARRAEQSAKALLTPATLFEAFGFRYIGPVSGHDLPALLRTLGNARSMLGNGEGPVLVHAITRKGAGYAPAEQDPLKYHGVTPFDAATGQMPKPAAPAPSYTAVFADALLELAQADPRIVAITAAMAGGTGLSRFAEALPEQFFDVGIAEQHAVTFAAGLATTGRKPVAAIYSTFLQRGFDQIVHDVCLQNLDVTFALDRAGLVGADGATHQGLYDIAYLRCLPNMVLMAPKDENELRHMLRTAIEYPGPVALRYPRGNGLGVPLDADIRALPIGRGELLREGDDLAIVALGTRVAPALAAAERLAAQGIEAAVFNARFVKPLDLPAIAQLVRHCGALLTVEEHALAGGFGSAVLEALAGEGISVPARLLAVPDRLVEHGDPAAQLAEFGLDVAGIAAAGRALVSSLPGCIATPNLRTAGR